MLDDATVEAMNALLQEAKPEEGMVVDLDDPVVRLLMEALKERIQYLNEVGLEYLISRFQQFYVERLPDKGLSSNDFTNELKDKLINTASKNDLNDVKNVLLDMINSITSFEYMVVSELPSKGKKGTIYLLRLTEFNTVKNLYEEYIWVNDRYELLGTLDLDQEGPFVTADDFKDTLKAYIQNIKIGEITLGPDGNGLADISSAIVGLITTNNSSIGAATKIKVNGSTYTPTNGLVTLPTLAHQLSLNGTAYTVGSTGTVTISGLAHIIKINGTSITVPTNGTVDLGDLATPGDIPTITIVLDKYHRYTANEDGEIVMDLIPYARQATLCNAEIFPDASYRNLFFQGLVAERVKVNGVTYYPDSTTGVVDLGDIGGGTIHTGTSEPSSSLGSDGDFYYKMPS